VFQADTAVLLISKWANVTAKDKLGKTPLHLATVRGYVEVARRILETDSPMLGIPGNNVKTALCYAAIKGNIDVVRLLLEQRRTMSRQHMFGGEERFLPFELNDENAEVVSLLFDSGILNPKSQGEDGRTLSSLCHRNGQRRGL
jgi:uncharacterized protein